MSFLESGGQRHPLPVGDLTIGSDPSAGLILTGAGVAPQHAVVQAQADGQTTVRKADQSAVLLVNDVPLGPNPTPLLHGDKLTIADHEFRFVDERQGGSTQYVTAIDPSTLADAAAKSAGRRSATVGTGGRLVSLTDGREYTISGVSLVIGRDANCDVVLTERSVSRRHTEIMATPKGYLLIDTSTNGTLVNGNRVEKQQLLKRSDVIQCGEHEIRFYADVAEAPAAPPPPAVAPPPPAAAPPPPAAVPPPPPAAVPPPPAPLQPPSAPEPPSLPPPVEQPSVPPPPAAAPGPPPGAAHRLSNTLHGIPAVPRPGSPAPPAPATPVRARPSPVEPPPGTPLAYLVVRSGDLKGQRYPIKVPIVNVGRAEYNDVVIADGSVSTMHAKLQRREGIWVLMDLESTNGTMVDGERVQGEMPIAPGAFIRFGNVSTVFEPTDDTVDAPKGSSTSVLNAAQIEQMLRKQSGGGTSGS